MRSPRVELRLKVFLLLICLTLAAAVPRAPCIGRRAAPTLPSQDPFYIPPPGYESAAPGAILNSRKVPNSIAAWGTIPIHVASAYQLLYRTTNTEGFAQAAVTTILVPYNADPTKLLSFQIAEDSASPDCAPSYILQTDTGVLNSGSATIEILFIIACLDHGWVLNIPDYEGPVAAFASGIQEGQATLDSIRAALASGRITGISPSAKYQMWGYSGGSIASEWAAELQPTYAPELNFTGMAIGGVVPNLWTVIYEINETIFAGLGAAAVLGLIAAYPDLKPLFDSQLINSTADAFSQAETEYLGSLILSYAFQDILGYFVDHGAALNWEITQEKVNATGIMGLHGVPQMPTYVYKAIGDEISPVNDTDALVEKLCSEGASIQYQRNKIGEHATEEITGSGDAFQWLKDRFDGVPAETGCSTTNVTLDALNLAAWEFFGSDIVDVLSALLQLPIGKIPF